MKKPILLIISERPDDISFGRAIADKLETPCAMIRSEEQLNTILNRTTNCVVFWDLDNESIWRPNSSIFAGMIQQILLDKIPEQRVFSLTSQPMSLLEPLRTLKAHTRYTIRHNILRPYEEGWIPLLTQAITPSFLTERFELSSFLSPSAKFQEIELTKSDHRLAAANAAETVLAKKGINRRVAEKVSAAVDELLMNAFFDAPKDPHGQPLRRALSRKARFDFNPDEKVTFTLGVDTEIVGLSVTDYFGSVDKNTLFRYLGQNFFEADYRPKIYDPGAGLGLYGIIHSGLSFQIICEKSKRTEAMLFLPMAKTYKSFDQMIRFSTIHFF